MNIIPVGEIMASHPDHARLEHDAQYETGSAYIIDRYLPLTHAGIPITDLGFTRADAVYDVVTVSRGQFFRLDYHQERFAASCAKIRLNNPFSKAEEAKVLHELVALTGLKDAYVWWGVTRGGTPLISGQRLNPNNFQNRFYAYVIPYIFINNDEQRTRGVNIHISEKYIRIPPNAVDPRAKNFCALDCNMALFEAGDQSREWSVLTDGQGVLTECPGSNIFIIKDNTVATPDLGCLEGITRQSSIDLCQELGLTCEVRDVTADELKSADEAFITSSAGGVMPIGQVNDLHLAHTKDGAGPISTRLHNLYWEKRWSGWDAVPVNYSI